MKKTPKDLARNQSRGQSTVEVVIIWTLVVAVVAAVAYNLLQPGIQNVYSESGAAITRAAAALQHIP